MSSLTRWDPFQQTTSLHEAMNQLLEHAVLRPGFAPTGQGLIGGMGGQMNVIEANGSYYCQFIVPGASSDHLDLTVRQNTLTLKARMPETLPDGIRKDATYLVREFGAGEFSRTVTFPKDVNGDAVQATFADGILTIKVPVAQHAQPRRITIQAGEASRAKPMVEAGSNTPSNEAGDGSVSAADAVAANGHEPARVS